MASLRNDARRIRAALLAAALGLGWACAPARGSRTIVPSDQEQVEAALSRYSELVLAMDHAGIAALFEPEGEIVNRGAPAIHGRAAIEKFLSGFADYHVLENNLKPASTVVQGDTAHQTGTYRQRVRDPDGKVLEVSGSFEAIWARAPTGAWQIRRMGTTPAP